MTQHILTDIKKPLIFGVVTIADRCFYGSSVTKCTIYKSNHCNKVKVNKTWMGLKVNGFFVQELELCDFGAYILRMQIRNRCSSILYG